MRRSVSTAVLCFSTFAVIVLVMIPSFRAHVSPKIPLKLGKTYYALATAHAALGTITEIAGLYIRLAGGASILSEKFRFTKYKLWMRTLLSALVARALVGIGNLRPLVRPAFVSKMNFERRPQNNTRSIEAMRYECP
jgi:hypothetical protein